MILNDTLQKHQDCLEQCDLERTACEIDRENDQICDAEMKNCQIICDLDYGP